MRLVLGSEFCGTGNEGRGLRPCTLKPAFSFYFQGRWPKSHSLRRCTALSLCELSARKRGGGGEGGQGDGVNAETSNRRP